MYCIYFRQITFIFSFVLFLSTACTTQTRIPQAEAVTARNGMVVSAHPDASRVGVEILKKGGNAVDAAIAVQFALAVTHPAAGNIGGGGFMVYRSDAGEVSTLDYREKAPALATETMYQDSAGNVIPNLSISGHLAAGVPGTVDGMVEAYNKYGSLPWKELVQPAVELALKGVVLTKKEADGLNRNKETFVNYNTHLPYLVKEGEWKEGDTLKHSALGYTLERIRDQGRAGFYEGTTAEMIVREMQTNNGIISLEDLANYHSVWRNAISGTYKGYTIYSMPPPSSGGVALLQLLKIVEGFNLDKKGWQTPETLHLMTEAERRVYADRATHLGDPDFYRVPVSSLLNEQYLLERRESIAADKKTPSTEIKAGLFASNESNETTHFSIVDKAGNAVSITTTLNGGYGSKVVVKEAGFLLNNEMDDFSIKPGSPNMYGLVGGKANAIAPGKRMLSSMTPTIIEKNGKLFMVVGTPGGSTIITSVFQTILNVVDHGMNMQEAVNAKRFHHQWLPDEILVEEEGFTPETRQTLEAKGHVIRQIPAIGRVDAIRVKKGGTLEAGADPRGDDTALGY